MRVLVTGAHGALGRRVTRALHRSGDHEVLELVSPRGGRSSADYAVDVGDRRAFRAAIELAAPDAVIHLAAVIGTLCETAPARAQKVNVDSVRTLTAAARSVGVQRVLLASSASVYGDHYDGAASEDSPIVLTSEYARTKFEGEQALAEVGGVESVSLRIFNVFGPGVRNSLVARLLASKAERPVDLWGLDSYVRDYVHADDVAATFLTSLTAPLPDGHAVFNVGSGIPTSNRDLIRGLGEDRLTYSVVEGPPSYSCARIELAQTWLDFRAIHKVEDTP